MAGKFLIVGIGGALGAMARYGISLAFEALHWSAQIATMSTNILGSLLMGILVSLSLQQPLLLLATVGFCGGFTTFSTFSVQCMHYIQTGNWSAAVLYMLATLILCVACAFIGYHIGNHILHP